MTMNMRMCNSEGYNTSPDAPNNWKSTPEMKLSARKRMMKQMRFGGTDMFVRADRRDLGVLLDAKKTIGKNGQRTRTNYKKGTSSSLTQNGEHEEGGTTINDLLLSAPKTDPTPQRTTNWTTHGLDASIMNKIRPMVTANHKNRGRAIENGHPNAAASASIDSDRYCHRSVGAQTLPDDEYPSHYYYHTPNFTPHVVDSPLIKCITPEDLPSKKKVIQDSLPEGTLRLVIQNFSQMTDTVRGPSKVVQDVPWRIMIMPRQHIVQKKGTTQKCLGFFLQCCPDAYSDSWSCQASAELRMIAQKPGVAMFHRKTNHVYTAKENDWGYSCFMTWAEILDEAQGYILNDVVILEVHVKAERAKNILSLGDFRKKINEYIRVSQMQCDRGLIDKAIDCNSQAMKFCKDKDPECFRRLQEQHKQLVEQKLKQSIARIERGGDSLANEADQASNITALRAAMTGNSTRTSAANRAKRGKDAKSTEKRRENDQNSDQTLPPDPTDFADGQQKTNTRNSTSSTVTSDKENDSLKETKEELRDTDLRLLDSSGELHTRESHCNGALTDEQIMSMADGLALPGGPQSPEELLKYLKAVSGDEEALQLMDEMFMTELLGEDNSAAEKLALPFRFELLARSLICNGGYTFADIVEKESNALFQMIVNENPDDLMRANEELGKKSLELADAYLALNPPLLSRSLQNLPRDQTKAFENILCRSVKQELASHNSSSQTEFPPLSQLMTSRQKCARAAKANDSDAAESKTVETTQGAKPTKKAKANAAAASLLAAGPKGDGGFTTTSGGMQPAVSGPTDANKLTYVPRGELSTVAKKRTYVDSLSDSSDNEPVYISTGDGNFFRAASPPGSSADENEPVPEFVMAFGDPAAVDEVAQEHYDLCEILHELQDSVFTFYSRICFEETPADSETKTDVVRAVGRNRLIDLFQSKLQYPPLYMVCGTPSSERCLSEPSLPTSGLKLEKKTDVRDACLKQLVPTPHLPPYDMTTRVGFNYLKTVQKLQERMVEWVNASEVGEQQAFFNRLHEFCQENHLLNRKTNNVPKASLESDEMPIMEDEDIMDAIFYAKNNKKMINHVSSIIDKIMSMQAKIDALKKENDELRKESKALTKEKTQLLKAQKNDRTQMEAMKNEAVQFRNSFKGLQKSYTESTEEVESLRAHVETLTAEAQQRESLHAREIQSLNDVKRNLSKELSERQSSNQKLKEQDKRQLQKVTERAKAAEITVVEQRMEQAVRTLQQTRAECDAKLDAIEQRLEMG
ncbi:MATH domain-containing protein [Aphelenchoides fujianensis]|nr:MATH domain-containing protein [Aphelenchoides fujianensis]